MSKRVLLLLSHSIEEFQQLDLLHSLGYEVASIGGYIDPANPHDDKRPALPHIPCVPEIKAAVDALGTADNLGAAQSNIPAVAFDWLGDDGIIVQHHHLPRLFGQWPRVRDWMRGAHGRVIWRSVGQSVANNEREAMPYRIGGLERIAYSPKEANIPGYSGHDALIRFWGEPGPEWEGFTRCVVQVSQHLRQRSPRADSEYTNWTYWDTATRDLPRMAVGPGSEVIGGPGGVSPDLLTNILRTYRAFLFTGSQPASYTLGLVEALHAGIPTVSIGAAWMRVDYDGHTAAPLFEGHEIAPLAFDDPNDAHHALRRLLNDEGYAADISRIGRGIAATLFDRATVGAQWASYLG